MRMRASLEAWAIYGLGRVPRYGRDKLEAAWIQSRATQPLWLCFARTGPISLVKSGKKTIVFSTLVVSLTTVVDYCLESEFASPLDWGNNGFYSSVDLGLDFHNMV
jgi:hypothetical protein